jgi:hypothetical protein
MRCFGVLWRFGRPGVQADLSGAGGSRKSAVSSACRSSAWRGPDGRWSSSSDGRAAAWRTTWLPVREHRKQQSRSRDRVGDKPEARSWCREVAGRVPLRKRRVRRTITPAMLKFERQAMPVGGWTPGPGWQLYGGSRLSRFEIGGLVVGCPRCRCPSWPGGACARYRTGWSGCGVGASAVRSAGLHGPHLPGGKTGRGRGPGRTFQQRIGMGDRA